MKKLTGLTILAVGLLLMATSVWAQHPVMLKIYATDNIGHDSLVLGLDPSATNQIDASLGEVEYPPPGPSFDVRFVSNGTSVGKDTLKQGTKVDYHHMIRVTQGDRWKIQFQSDDSGTAVHFSWVIIQAGGNGFTMSDGGANIATPIDMTTQSSFTYPVKTTAGSGPQFVYIDYFDGLKLTTVAQESLSATAALKLVKRKNYLTSFEFDFAGPYPTHANGLHIEFSDAITVGPNSPFTHVSSPKAKIYELSAPPGGVIPASFKVTGIGGKGKTISAKKFWWIESVGDTNAAGKKAKPLGPATGPAQQFFVPMPNTNNVGSEIYIKGGSGMTVGVNAVVGQTVAKSPKPIYRYDVLPTWADAQKGLNNKGTMQTGAASCFVNFNGKPIVKGLKGGLDPAKLNDVLYAEDIALQFNIAAQNGHTENPGLAGLIYNKAGSPLSGLTVQAISDSLNWFMSWCSGVKTATDYYNAAHDINTAFSGPFDTTAFGGGVTIMKGVRAVGTVPYLYRLTAEVAPVAALPPYREAATPVNYRLNQNYPNPFNPSTRISFELPQDALVTLKVYNILGQEVATLVNREQMQQGTNEVTFDASRMATGVYFYHLIVNDGQFQQVKKMMLVK